MLSYLEIFQWNEWGRVEPQKNYQWVMSEFFWTLVPPESNQWNDELFLWAKPQGEWIHILQKMNDAQFHSSPNNKGGHFEVSVERSFLKNLRMTFLSPTFWHCHHYTPRKYPKIWLRSISEIAHVVGFIFWYLTFQFFANELERDAKFKTKKNLLFKSRRAEAKLSSLQRLWKRTIRRWLLGKHSRQNANANSEPFPKAKQIYICHNYGNGL